MAAKGAASSERKLRVVADGKRLKTATAVRTVAIHSQFITLGWLQHVDAVQRRDGATAWLFPEISPQVRGALKAWTKWFSRYLRSVGIIDDSKVFHSFRHTFKDALRAAGVPEALNDALTGQKNSIVRRFGMPRLRDAVYGVKYEGLKLSKLKHAQH
jgi:integrase